MTLGVEEEEVDREPHTEGVDAAATGDQQPLARPPGPEEGEPEQAGEEGDRDRHPPGSDLRGGEPAEAVRVGGGGHSCNNPGRGGRDPRAINPPAPPGHYPRTRTRETR